MTGIYVIGTRGRFCKIGQAVDMAQRIQSLKTACPFDLYVIAVIEHPRQELTWWERLYHEIVAEHWIRGEWYSLTEEETNFFRNEEINSFTMPWGLIERDPPHPYIPDQVPLEWRGPYVEVPLTQSLALNTRAVTCAHRMLPIQVGMNSRPASGV